MRTGRFSYGFSHQEIAKLTNSESENLLFGKPGHLQYLCLVVVSSWEWSENNTNSQLHILRYRMMGGKPSTCLKKKEWIAAYSIFVTISIPFTKKPGLSFSFLVQGTCNASLLLCPKWLSSARQWPWSSLHSASHYTRLPLETCTWEPEAKARRFLLGGSVGRAIQRMLGRERTSLKRTFQVKSKLGELSWMIRKLRPVRMSKEI